jgi:vitamin B12 transporter
MNRLLLAYFLLHSAACIATLPETIVVATSTPFGQSLNTVDSSAITTKQYNHIRAMLSTSPSAQVNTIGGMNTLSIRGMNEGRSLVIYDGIRLNDPSATNQEANLTSIVTHDLQSSELITGAEALYYGSGAIGGVLVLKSKQGTPGTTSAAHLEGGRYQTLDAGAQALHNTKDKHLFVSVNQWRSGTGTLWNPQQHVAMSDHVVNSHFNLKGTIDIQPHHSLTALAQGSQSHNFINTFNPKPYYLFENGDRSKTTTGSYALGHTYKLWQGRWVHRLLLSHQQNQRQYSTESLSNKFTGQTQRLVYDSDYTISDQLLLHYGGDAVKQLALTSTPSSRKALYDCAGQLKLTYRPLASWRFFVSSRIDKPQKRQAYPTVQSGVHYHFNDSTLLIASTGTGLKLPSLSNSMVTPWHKPNPHLKPEHAFVWDISLEKSFLRNRVKTKTTYYSIQLKDMITYSPAQQTSINQDKKVSRGLEFSTSLLPTDDLEMNMSFTYARATLYHPAKRALQSPRYKTSLSFIYSFCETTSAFIEGVHKSRQRHYPAVTLPSTTATRLGINHEINDHAKVYGRVENVLNQRRQEIYPYARRGTAFYAGMRIQT